MRILANAGWVTCAGAGIVTALAVVIPRSSLAQSASPQSCTPQDLQVAQRQVELQTRLSEQAEAENEALNRQITQLETGRDRLTAELSACAARASRTPEPVAAPPALTAEIEAMLRRLAEARDRMGR